ncbi:MAG: HAD family phosphatase [Candidatus Woykebacteria bacterium]
MTRAIIFDLDGVLVNTEPLWYEAFEKVSREFGFEYSEELHRLSLGRSDHALRLTIKMGISEKHPEFLERIREVFKSLFEKRAKLMPGVVDLLPKLKDKYKLAIATSAYKPRLDYNLEKFPELKKFFDAFVSGDLVEKSKPAPDIFLLAAGKLGVDSKECLVIEDAESGVAAAKKAGMKVIGVAPKHMFYQDLSKADKIVISLSDIRLTDLK